MCVSITASLIFVFIHFIWPPLLFCDHTISVNRLCRSIYVISLWPLQKADVHYVSKRWLAQISQCLGKQDGAQMATDKWGSKHAALFLVLQQMSNAIREHSGKKKTFWGTFGTLERSQGGAQAHRHGGVRVHAFKIYGNKASVQLINQTSHFSENENWLLCPQASVNVINVCAFELLCLYGSDRPAIEIALSHNHSLSIQKSYVNATSYRWAKWHQLCSSLILVTGDRGEMCSAQLSL